MVAVVKPLPTWDGLLQTIHDTTASKIRSQIHALVEWRRQFRNRLFPNWEMRRKEVVELFDMLVSMRIKEADYWRAMTNCDAIDFYQYWCRKANPTWDNEFTTFLAGPIEDIKFDIKTNIETWEIMKKQPGSDSPAIYRNMHSLEIELGRLLPHCGMDQLRDTAKRHALAIAAVHRHAQLLSASARAEAWAALGNT
jgi:hypothetical protein